MAASQPRRVLAEAGDPAAPEERRPGRDGRHRLVRRRGPVRLVQDVSGDREAEPEREQRAGRRPLASRRLGLDRRRQARPGLSSAPRPPRSTGPRSSCRSSRSTSRTRSSPRRPRRPCSRPARNAWRTFDAWPPQELQRRQLFLREERQARLRRSRRGGAAFDEYVSDPAKPVPFTERITPPMAIEYMTDDQRFAARRPDVLVYQTAAARGRPGRGRPARRRPVGLHHRHRRRLHRQADRRLSRLTPMPPTQPGYQMLRPQRSLPRPLPQQLREARSRSCPASRRGSGSSCSTCCTASRRATA